MELSEQHEKEAGRTRRLGEARSAIDRTLEQAEELIDAAPEQALRLADQASQACQMAPFEKKPYQRGLAYSYRISAAAYLNQGDFGQALKFHSKSFAVFKALNDRAKIASQLNNIGTVYAYCADYAEALKHLRAAEAYIDERTPADLKAQILNNIGFTYLVLGEHAHAIALIQQSLEAAQSVPDAGLRKNLIALANIYDSLCQAYLAQHDLEAALDAAQKSTGFCRQVGDLRKEAEYLLILGEVYSRMENPRQAAGCFQQALELAREHGFRREEAEAYRRLGLLHGALGDAVQAARLLGDALAIAGEIKIQREVYECHLAFANLYKHEGDFEKALRHFEAFHQIKETVFNEQSDQRLKNLEILHQVEQARREADIHQLKSIELQREIEERKKAQELAEILANTDVLTGIFNRRYFVIQAERLIEDALMKKTPLSTFVIDVDHFKMINDRYGHQVGDLALTAIAHKISITVRKSDIVGRYGGEEFVVLLPETDPDRAEIIAERLRIGVETLEISPVIPELRATISLGIASLDSSAAPDTLVLEKLLEQADQAMYAAKRQGRNRGVSYGFLTQSPQQELP